MYVARIPNRKSPPCILIRESYREDGKIKKRTIANITNLPEHVIDGIQVLLKKGPGASLESLDEAFEITQSQAYGHVLAALGTAKKLKLPELLGEESPERQRVLAMILARLLAPGSKLATARGLDGDAHLSALGQALNLGSVSAKQLYSSMDWLLSRKEVIEKKLAKRHLKDGSLVLYDLTSTYFEGQTCPLAQRGYSRDGKKGKLQIVFGLLCDAEGRPVGVEVFEGNTADPKTVQAQIDKVRQRFALERVIFVGDRGCLTSARLREHFEGVDGLEWLSALRTTEIRKLVNNPGLQQSLFDEKGFVELSSAEFPGERLVVCRNPLLADRRLHKREELLRATEEDLEKIFQATQREKRALKGQDRIGLRVGKVLDKHKVGKHFQIEIEDDGFTYRRKQDKIDREAALDGIYVLRTSVTEEHLSSEEVIRAYKGLSVVETAFRSCKSVDLQVRPIHHALSERVRAHIFICMLAYYLEWHMRKALAPLLFAEEDPAAAEEQRISPVKPAKRSPQTLKKVTSLKTKDGLPVHSYRTLMAELSDLRKETILPAVPNALTFEKITRPSALQARAFELLGVKIA